MRLFCHDDCGDLHKEYAANLFCYCCGRSSSDKDVGELKTNLPGGRRQ